MSDERHGSYQHGPDDLLPVIDALTRLGQHLWAKVAIDARDQWLAERKHFGVSETFRLVVPPREFSDFEFLSGSAHLRSVVACLHGNSDGSCNVKGCPHYNPVWDPPKSEA